MKPEDVNSAVCRVPAEVVSSPAIPGFSLGFRLRMFVLFGAQVALGFLGGGLILTTIFSWLSTGRLIYSLGTWGSLLIAVPGFVAGGLFFAYLDVLTRLSRGIFALGSAVLGFVGTAWYLLGVVTFSHGGHLVNFLHAPFHLLGEVLSHPASVISLAAHNPLGAGLVAWLACPVVGYLMYPPAKRAVNRICAQSAARPSLPPSPRTRQVSVRDG